MTTSNTVKIIPTNICGKDVAIKANIVDNDIPMLISRRTLKGAKASIDFENDILKMDDIPQELITTSSGHLAIALAPQDKFSLSVKGEKTEEILLSVDESPPKEIALKIHRYFGYASAKRLKVFVEQSQHPQKGEIVKELDSLD